MKPLQEKDEEFTTRDYTVTDGNTIVCYKSAHSNCVVVDTKVTGGANAFLTAREATGAHDADLMACTDEINRLLSEAMKKKQDDDSQHLSILLTDRGPFLAWVHGGVEDDSAAVDRALKIEN